MHFAISESDSLLFARISGDYNALHLDPVLARRTVFGGTVAHGVHVLLAALNVVVESFDAVDIRALAVSFDSPVRSGDICSVQVSNNRTTEVQVIIRVKNRVVQRISCSLSPRRVQLYDVIDSPIDRETCETDLTFDESYDFAGSVQLQLDGASVAKLFPSLSGRLSRSQLATIVATSRIVGMKCPGRDSVFVGLTLAANPAVVPDPTALTFRVTKRDQRFRMVSLSVEGAAFTGRIQALFRQSPTPQPTYAEVASRIRRSLFPSRDALVIGGSRGLGELAAKILAASGARVVISYALGRADAERVAKEIGAGGGVCSTVEYDVLASEPESLRCLLLRWTPSHVYYFATPLIETNFTSIWDALLFDKFCSFYVSGFSRCLEEVLRSRDRSQHVSVFYPSTIFVNTPEASLKEYAVAKMAGEALCRQLSFARDDFSVEVHRLPRLLTDQTASLKVRVTCSALDELSRVLFEGDARHE
jgi:hypothetical protein